ncbi:MAG: hypothetical protein EBU46_01355 [Nitrosomonadaceae bacterium]|nr:hypothetical protein [Nitrosomonadaceae bacterium]
MTMNETEEISKIVLHMHPIVAVEKQPWDIRTCAIYMKISESRFRQVVAPHPSFPKSFRIAGGHPRWMAGEVIAWVESEYEKQTRSRS